MNSMNEKVIKRSSRILLYRKMYVYVSSVYIEINEMEKVNLILNRLHFSEQFYVFSIPFQIRLAFNVCRLNCCVKSRYIFLCNFNSFLY